jgi:hypothetical protein
MRKKSIKKGNKTTCHLQNFEAQRVSDTGTVQPRSHDRSSDLPPCGRCIFWAGPTKRQNNQLDEPHNDPRLQTAERRGKEARPAANRPAEAGGAMRCSKNWINVTLPKPVGPSQTVGERSEQKIDCYFITPRDKFA